jgi:hypothetical protein
MWHSQVIDEMSEMKDAGVPFETAWRLALQRHPPRSMDLGPQVATLFDDEAQETPLVEWVRRACSDAWFGRRPVLRGLVAITGGLLGRDPLDEPRTVLLA